MEQTTTGIFPFLHKDMERRMTDDLHRLMGDRCRGIVNGALVEA